MSMPEITQKNFRILLPGKIAAVVEKVAAHKKCSGKEALLAFYQSNLYRQLENEKTKCWWESPEQLYQDYISESE